MLNTHVDNAGYTAAKGAPYRFQSGFQVDSGDDLRLVWSSITPQRV
jgi:hypothetical protein